MACAKKCDRCKDYYEKNYFKSDKFFNTFKFENDNVMGISIDTKFANGYSYDLCDNCLELLSYFLSNKEIRFKGVL